MQIPFVFKEAEQNGLTAEDVQVALNHCGDANTVAWLKENWDNMMETVMTLASNVGHEAEENTIGTLSKPEAKEALRKHKGNIWAAVTECVEQRQMKVSVRFINIASINSIHWCFDSMTNCAPRGTSPGRTLSPC